MSKEMLDILVEPKKVEELAGLKTNEEVQKKFASEGVKVTSEQVEDLGKVFDVAAKKLDESALWIAGGGLSLKSLNIDWKSPKAKKAYKIIGGIGTAAAVIGGAYVADKKFNEGKGAAAIGAIPGKVMSLWPRGKGAFLTEMSVNSKEDD